MSRSRAHRTSTPGRSRVLVLCALVAGLFLMHGSPATAAVGCHGHQNPVAAPAHPAAGGGAAMAAGDAAPAAHTGAPALRAATDGARPHAGAGLPRTGGELCVSTPARDRLPLPSADTLLAFGLAALLLIPLAARRPGTGGPAHRGPPWSGRALLLQVCVART
jgi:hypothetical protein